MNALQTWQRKHRLGFLTSYVVVYFMIWGERWLFVLFLLVDMLTITVQIVFSKYFRECYGCEVIRITIYEWMCYCPCRQGHSNFIFVCKSHYIDRFMIAIKTEWNIRSAVLTHGHAGQLPAAYEHRGPMLIYVWIWYVFFYCFNCNFVGSTNTVIICLILSSFTVLFVWVVV